MHKPTAEPELDHYFGGCPHCGDTDGYVNAGRVPWFVCGSHTTRWRAGENLFSCWAAESKEDHHVNTLMLETYDIQAWVLFRRTSAPRRPRHVDRQTKQ